MEKYLAFFNCCNYNLPILVLSYTFGCAALLLEATGGHAFCLLF